MSSPYREILTKLRLVFPSPVSDLVHDSYFVHSIMLAVDEVDALKGNRLQLKLPLDHLVRETVNG